MSRTNSSAIQITPHNRFSAYIPRHQTHAIFTHFSYNRPIVAIDVMHELFGRFLWKIAEAVMGYDLSVESLTPGKTRNAPLHSSHIACVGAE
jgi:hypothetical protein